VREKSKAGFNKKNESPRSKAYFEFGGDDAKAASSRESEVGGLGSLACQKPFTYWEKTSRLNTRD